MEWWRSMPFHFQPILLIGHSLAPPCKPQTHHLRALRSFSVPTFTPPSKREPPPAPISSSSRKPPLLHISTPVAFQHSWPGSPNGFQANLDFKTFDHTTPILIRYSH
ncbi:hypothetical protein AVEN_234368-1 [Araneus ventricosus]|uniref:Uncharacterized protein n=1 Tax=Araneus ventricosus TaxID=182803 RepID=A0A4Y2A875_ARAVE|nr:hypothetical protein AVEN_234368-1 [Araneus ventricosus]